METMQDLKELTICGETFNMEDFLEEIENVPFDSSMFQFANFTPATQSPARRYRQALMELSKVLNALHDAKISKDKFELDIEEIEYKMSQLNEANVEENFKIRRLQIELNEKNYNMKGIVNLINDAVYKAEFWYKQKEDLPKVTRAQFESSEREYWKSRLAQDADDEVREGGRPKKGTIQALRQIGISTEMNPANGQITLVDFENEKNLLEARSQSLLIENKGTE